MNGKSKSTFFGNGAESRKESSSSDLTQMLTSQMLQGRDVPGLMGLVSRFALTDMDTKSFGSQLRQMTQPSSIERSLQRQLNCSQPVVQHHRQLAAHQPSSNSSNNPIQKNLLKQKNHGSF